MYPVSDKYIAARRAAFREERITGGIKLKDGTIIAVDDSVLVQGSLSITSKVCTNDRFDIGSANCSVMSLKIKDKNAYDHEFGGALIKLTYGIVVETAEDGTKTWESVPLPPFFVGASSDSDSCVRKRDMVTLKAYDTMSLLDINFPDTIPSDSMWSALVYVCNRAGIGLAITEDEFSALPNSDIVPDFSGESIESCRDVVMWIAQTTGCCAFCDYRGLLMLKAYKYEGSNNYDRLFTANERKTIEYSDTRTYLAYLQAYVGDDKVQYSQVTTWTGTDAPHIKEGVLSLPKNPILRKLTTAQQETINQSYFTNRSYPTRYIKADCFVDPALELLDVVAFSGGNIDVGQIINVATQIKWKYRGKGTIYCASVAEAADTALEESSQSAEVVSLSALSDTANTADTASESDIIKVQPRSQTEKQIDELAARSGVATKLQSKGAAGWVTTDSKGAVFSKSGSVGANEEYAHLYDSNGGFMIRNNRGGLLHLPGVDYTEMANAKIELMNYNNGLLIQNNFIKLSGNTAGLTVEGGKFSISNNVIQLAHGSNYLWITLESTGGFKIETSGGIELRANSAGLYFNGVKIGG